MCSRKSMLRKEVVSSALILLAALTGMACAVGCNDAQAMGKKQMPVVVDPGPAPVAVEIPAPAVTVTPVATATPTVERQGTEKDGYELGLHNGQVLVERIRQRTVEEKGCGAIGELQSTLLTVSRSLRAPQNLSDKVVRGYYRGYLDAIREAIRDVRSGCNEARFDDGSFAGSLYGTVACQAAADSALPGLELEPLYSGWSGGSESVLTSCKDALGTALQACDSASALSELAAEGCVDL